MAPNVGTDTDAGAVPPPLTFDPKHLTAPPDGDAPPRLLLNTADWQAAAKTLLPRQVYDYYAAGADDLVSLSANASALAAHALRPRVLVPVGSVSAATSLLGVAAAAPIVVAPTAMHRMAHADGELAVARAAAAVGVPMTLSTMATSSLEAVAAAPAGGVGTRWFQLYVFGGAARATAEKLVRRAQAAGYTALVLTVDAPVYGNRETDVRNSFALPAGLRLANFVGDAPPAGSGSGGAAGEPVPPVAVADMDKASAGSSGLASFGDTNLDPNLSFDCIAWLRSISTLPVLVKGCLRGDDAAAAMAAGAAGIVVSNHGARQLDGTVAPITALREVVAAVKGPDRPAGSPPGLVLVDGAIRRGTDVLKAVALGADAVMVGRPVLWGLAVAGEEGVARVLGGLVEEVRRAMMLAGVPAWDRIPRGLVVLPDGRVADRVPVDPSAWQEEAGGDVG